MDKSLEELSKVDGLDQFFIFHQPVKGLPMPKKTIYDSEEFIEWKEKAKHQLRNLKPSAEIDEIIEQIDSFHGWSDESKLKKLKAKIHVTDHRENLYQPSKDRKGDDDKCSRQRHKFEHRIKVV